MRIQRMDNIAQIHCLPKNNFVVLEYEASNISGVDEFRRPLDNRRVVPLCIDEQDVYNGGSFMCSRF